MNPRVHTIEATTHGRYFTAPPEDGGPAPLLVGFHGYGETAEQHLDALRRIPGHERWLVVSVEALHLFYTKTRDVVGCWMTRVLRDEAIEDNTGYVARVLEEVRRDPAAGEGVVFAGFSQGVAMAYRAAVRAGAGCRGVVALAADLPPDVAESRAALPPVLIGRGTTDWWYTREKHEHDLKALEGRARVESLVFEGGHEWTDTFARAAGDFLERIRAGRAAGPTSPGP